VIRLTIPGRPIPAVRMTQKSKYTDRQAHRYLDYKSQIAWIAKGNRVRQIDGPVVAEIYLYLCGGNQGDCDNYAKSLTDALNKIAYKDDRQIKRLVVEKRECGRPAEQRAEVIIEPWEVA
jgi:crossover junction endodeoxyribonuclease RusA